MTSVGASNSPTRFGVALLCFLLVCYGVAGSGVVATEPSLLNWYAGLHKPGFNPPNWIFAPVWTALYGLMAIAAWLVWKTPADGPGSKDRRAGLILFAIQLALNGLWTPVFFSLHQLLPALIVITLLWAAILGTILRFWRVERFAGSLLIPYLLWVGFATALNYKIYRLN